MVTSAGKDLEDCEALVARAAAGDAGARRQLVEQLWPAWLALVRSSRSMGALARSEDDIHNVVARLVEKIGDDNGHALQTYLPWRRNNRGKTFGDWIRIVTANAIRDYVREKVGPRQSPDGTPSPKRLLNEFASSTLIDEQGGRPPFTAAETARQLLEFAHANLPLDQLSALRLWLQGATPDEIGHQLGITSIEAGRLVRAGVAVIRRRFAPADGSENVDDESDCGA